MHVFVFQSSLCQGLAPRVFRLIVNDVGTFKEYGMQFEKAGNVERCYALCWDGVLLEKICAGSQSLDQVLPQHERLPLTQVVNCFEDNGPCVNSRGKFFPHRVFHDNRADGRRFLVWQSFDEEVYLQCFHQSHQNIFGTFEVTAALEYAIHCLKGALYEDWTEDRSQLGNNSQSSLTSQCPYVCSLSRYHTQW